MRIELKRYFDYILENYLKPENSMFSSQMEYYKVIVNRIPEEISKLFDNKKYKIYGSCGKGTKSASPYIAISDRNITTSTQRGIYVDFIFKSDMTGFYLTIDQGITNIKEKYGNKDAKEIAQNAAEFFRNIISDINDFETGLVSGHTKSGSLEEGYENTRVIAKYYESKNYTNDELIKKKKKIMTIYNEIIDKMSGKSYDQIVNELSSSSRDMLCKKNSNKVWLYAPGENAMYWQDCIDNNTIYIGWDDLGDLRKYSSDDEIYEAIKNIYGGDNPKMSKCACSDFCKVMRPGDVIIVKKGTTKLLGYGIVTSDYIYDPERSRYKHTRKVEWKKIGEWINNTGTGNPIKTLTEISQYEGYPEELLSIINGGNNMNKSTEWIIPANPKYYDHNGSFDKFGFIDWTQNVNFNVGDIVYVYTGAPKSSITVQTIVEKTDMTSDEKVDDDEFNKTGDLLHKRQEKDRFVRLKRVKTIDDSRLNYDELIRHGLGGRPQSAIRISEELSKYISNVLNDDVSGEYNKDKFLEEVFIDSDKYDSIVSVLGRKKNIILEGAPGVGKTFIAKRLAYSLIGNKDNSKIKVIQFHQNYSYEDFIEGYRPTDNGFKLEKGIFYNFCEQAKKDPDNDYYMIIDEINRGNLSKIFGELLMLIENDKRGMDYKLTLAYSKEDFYVPDNLYIIGLMNTADRSLALIDYALRRRFSFVRIEPAFESEKFIKAFNQKFDEQYNTLINIIKSINNDIENDRSLGSGFEIGHSYFLPKLKDAKGNKKDLEDIVRFEIIPLLEEYWYDDEDSLIKWKDSLFGYFK